MSSPADLLRKYGIRPRKDYGQHFLSDPAILRREVTYANITAEDIVLEIGPGLGNLTAILAAKAKQVYAIERDRALKPVLGELTAAHSNLRIIWGDALSVPLPHFTKIVANLPYRVALPLTFRLLESDFETGVLILQQSQAEKLCAHPGKPGYGRISVQVQRVANLKYLEVIRQRSFTPPPLVESAMVRVSRIPPKFPVGSEDYFRRLLDFLFLERTATLKARLLKLAKMGDQNKPVGESLSMLADLREKEITRITPDAFGRIAAVLNDKTIQIPSLSNEQKRRGPKPRP